MQTVNIMSLRLYRITAKRERERMLYHRKFIHTFNSNRQLRNCTMGSDEFETTPAPARRLNDCEDRNRTVRYKNRKTKRRNEKNGHYLWHIRHTHTQHMSNGCTVLAFILTKCVCVCIGSLCRIVLSIFYVPCVRTYRPSDRPNRMFVHILR